VLRLEAGLVAQHIEHAIALVRASLGEKPP